MDDIHLKDEQYLEIIKKLRREVETTNKPFRVYDDETIGNKSTTSTVGLCNDELYFKREYAMFPDTPDRKCLKYRQNHHLCPFDGRVVEYLKTGDVGMSGCYYTCLMRDDIAKKFKVMLGKEYVIDMVDKLLKKNS